MKRLFALLFLINLYSLLAAQNNITTPDKIFGELFKEVQLQRIFNDGKTFVDCIPKKNPKDIMSDFNANKKNLITKTSLEQFVKEHFELPSQQQSNYQSNKQEAIVTHIKNLWTVLKRNPDSYLEGNSLLPLPNAYIVPGGRFREIYYWDSYFTMLGLAESNEWEIIENMVNNFSYLIQTYGHIPNGNRTYYLSRSQPPFFSLMIDLLAEKKGSNIYATYLQSLQKEYDYWMDKTITTKHVVTMPDGSTLNRYYDQDEIPRQESFREDYELIENSKNENASTMARNLRSGAESGWDFSSRWFADGKNISTIQTTNLIPVDLNGLLYHLETTLAKAYKETGNLLQFNLFNKKAEERKNAINKYCWSNSANWYVDFNISNHQQSIELTAAGISPLFFLLASNEKAKALEKTLNSKFLKSGGVVTTLKNTKQQWDAPNGWAPLQWITIKGLENYHFSKTAKTIAERWIHLNTVVYERTGKLMEKYNVENISLDAGGGEYPGQDGFGWTNGVLLKLISIYGK
jgi:alpha,alpha-trehalase